MNKLSLIITTFLATVLFAGSAVAASTSVGLGISRGDSDSMAYSLNISQKYEPMVDTEAVTVTPIAEIGGHVWIDKDDDVDKVWGAYLAPGLRVNLNTDKNIRPYVEGTLGGAVNSESEMDDKDFGSNALFRARGAVGVSFGEELRHKVQGDYTHYSTFGLSKKDDGYNTYGLSYGYSF